MVHAPEIQQKLQPRPGRPRSETVQKRRDELIAAATRVFLRDGYGFASIDKVAREAGVSTRTIYERYKNKADLLDAVISRLVDRDIATLSPAEFDRLEVKEALVTIGRRITERARDPDVASMFRILATEAIRFPELAAKMRETSKERIDGVIEGYLRAQVTRGALQLADPARAASLFMQMICAQVHEGFLFGFPSDVSTIDFTAHVAYAVDLFLNGAMPRAKSLTNNAD